MTEKQKGSSLRNLPVTRNYDHDDTIGTLTLREDVDVPFESVFAIGGHMISHNHFVLREISLIPEIDQQIVADLVKLVRDYRTLITACAPRAAEELNIRARRLGL